MAAAVYMVILLTAACERADRTTADEAPRIPRDDMVLVPAGPFLMGDPPREVELHAFWIDRTEVTQGDYDACVAAGVCAMVPVVIEPPPPRHPVVRLTWDDAATYCAWLGKQLPTEAQWEKAARGVDGRTYPWGNDPPTCERAMFERWTKVSGSGGHTDACGASRWFEATHPVGSHPSGASPYGALDMAGNALEWTSDVDGAFRVVRGARLVGGTEDELRTSYRRLQAVTRASPDPELRMLQGRDPLIGFRCVRNRRERESVRTPS